MHSSLEVADPPRQLERTRPLLGTFVSIRVAGDSENGDAAITAAFASIADVQRTMSFHDPDSELSRINRRAFGEPQCVSPALFRVLRSALALARASDGRFDPTVAWRLVASGHLPAPAPFKIDTQASWRDVELDHEGRVQYRRSLWLDLGGIAKGYAVDRAVRTLKRHGVLAGSVNAGGDLRVFGHTETIHVRDPADPRRQLPILQVRDAAVATSAGYFSERSGRTDLIDPPSGNSLAKKSSVTVCARRAIWADALTKVVLAAPERSTALLRRLRASALLIDRDGRRRQVS